MKVTVDVECTPEEARAFLGLPDVSALQNEFIDRLRTFMEQGTAVEAMQMMVQGLSLMSEPGLAYWRQLLSHLSSPPRA